MQMKSRCPLSSSAVTTATQIEALNHPAHRWEGRVVSARLTCAGCLAGPAELCGGGAGVGVSFVGGGADDFLGDFRVETFAPARGEGFLHTTIFAGMKGEHGHAPAGIEARVEMAEKGFEGRELVVHRNAESLEYAAEAEIPVVTGKAWQRGADGGGQGAGAGEATAGQGIREQSGVWFVGVLCEHGGQGGWEHGGRSAATSRSRPSG